MYVKTNVVGKPHSIDKRSVGRTTHSTCPIWTLSLCDGVRRCHSLTQLLRTAPSLSVGVEEAEVEKEDGDGLITLGTGQVVARSTLPQDPPAKPSRQRVQNADELDFSSNGLTTPSQLQEAPSDGHEAGVANGDGDSAVLVHSGNGQTYSVGESDQTAQKPDAEHSESMQPGTDSIDGGAMAARQNGLDNGTEAALDSPPDGDLASWLMVEPPETNQSKSSGEPQETADRQGREGEKRPAADGPPHEEEEEVGELTVATNTFSEATSSGGSNDAYVPFPIRMISLTPSEPVHEEEEVTEVRVTGEEVVAERVTGEGVGSKVVEQERGSQSSVEGQNAVDRDQGLVSGAQRGSTEEVSTLDVMSDVSQRIGQEQENEGGANGNGGCGRWCQLHSSRHCCLCLLELGSMIMFHAVWEFPNV